MRAPQTSQRRGTAASALPIVLLALDLEGEVTASECYLLGRSAWLAIWRTRAALLAEDELKRTARAGTRAVMGARVARVRRANMVAELVYVLVV